MNELAIDYLDICLLIVVTIFSTIISSTTGSGGGVLLFSFMTLYLPLFIIIPVHGFVQMFTNGFRSYLLRDVMRLKLFIFFALSASVGAICAGAFLPKISKTVPYLIITTFIFYTIFKPKNIPDIVLGNRGFAIVGFFAGILGILVGAIGPFLALFFVRKDLTKEEIVANKSAMQGFIHSTKLPIFLYLGFSYFEYSYLILVILVSGVIGTRIGIYALKWIPQIYFFTLFKCALFFAGLKLLHQVFF
ncbi:sulfite exporter TauE/SafE family protein [Candidatus Uabimicrobium sp. HlEnr_7]|uniref:sulfite exporter TauE/SafE family protein n=1 Tax=Candidatus Uabimicrobium helgolandensis TaxID=3095367 RepID=UPI003558660B